VSMLANGLLGLDGEGALIGDSDRHRLQALGRRPTTRRRGGVQGVLEGVTGERERERAAV
jgi:hypothetical protein